MNLQSLSIYHYKRPFEVSFSSSHMKRNCSESVILLLDFHNGIRGLGECAPRSYVTGETIASVYKSITDCYAPLLFQSNIESFADIERVLTELEKNGCRSYRDNLSAISCIDLALIDALAHKEHLNIQHFLGAPIRDKAPLSLTIPLISPTHINDKWHLLQSWLPVQSVKVVVAGPLSQNIDRVAYIRNVVGSAMDMRIEVNGQWTYSEACDNLAHMRGLNISGIEEPLTAAEQRRLPHLRDRFAIPVILDESICTFEDAVNAIENGHCDIINIKISKCGGLINAQKIIRKAAQSGIDCQIGTHVGESFILDAAGWHLALAVKNLTYFEGCSFLLHNPSLSADGISPSRQNQPHKAGWGLKQRDIRELLSHSELLIRLSP